MAPPPRISRVFGAVNLGSFRISAMIAGLTLLVHLALGAVLALTELATAHRA